MRITVLALSAALLLPSAAAAQEAPPKGGSFIEDCRNDGECRAWLEQPIAGLSDDDAFELITIKAAMATAWRPFYPVFKPLCAATSNARVLELLRQHHPRSYDFDACALSRVGWNAFAWPTLHTQSGERATQVTVTDIVVKSATERVADVSYNGFEGWRCTFRKHVNAWHVATCHRAWIS